MHSQYSIPCSVVQQSQPPSINLVLSAARLCKLPDLVMKSLLCFTISFAALAVSAITPSDWKHLPDLPNQLGVAGAFAGVSGNSLVVAGGANFPGRMPWEGGTKKWHDTVWVLDRPDGQWCEAGKLPRPLGYGVSVTTDRGIICVGGSDIDRHYADVFRLSVINGKADTMKLPSLPSALANSCGALVESVFYIVGGNEKPGETECVARAFALDLADVAKGWKEIEKVPGRPRFLCAAAADNGVLWVVGGATLAENSDGKMERVYLHEVWAYRPGSGWARHTDMIKPAVAAPTPAPVINGRMLVLTGDDGSRRGFQPPDKHPGFARAIQSFDINEEKWSMAGEMPAGRAVLPCVRWGDHLVIVNGEQRPGVRTPEVLALPLK